MAPTPASLDLLGSRFAPCWSQPCLWGRKNVMAHMVSTITCSRFAPLAASTHQIPSEPTCRPGTVRKKQRPTIPSYKYKASIGFVCCGSGGCGDRSGVLGSWWILAVADEIPRISSDGSGTGWTRSGLAQRATRRVGKFRGRPVTHTTFLHSPWTASRRAYLPSTDSVRTQMAHSLSSNLPGSRSAP